MANDATKGDQERVPYFRYAFHNIYNYTLMGGVATTALLTQNWWLAVAGAGAEVLWMVFGPDSRLLRKVVFDKVHAEKVAQAATEERNRTLAALPESDADRVRALEAKHEEILRLCGENRALASDMLHGELRKLDQLRRSFADLLLSTNRYQVYLQNSDLSELEAEMRRYTDIVTNGTPEDRALAQKNLAVLQKRKVMLAELQRSFSQAHGQLELIENTFRLLADQIVTMRSPGEFGGQLDDLIDGVEAVRTTARETEVLLEPA